MIKSVITLSSMFVDKPKTIEILLNDNDVAMEHLDEATGSKVKTTVGQLFDLYKRRSVYYNDGREVDSQITPDVFEQWFYFKHINGKAFSQRILKIEYQRIK